MLYTNNVLNYATEYGCCWLRVLSKSNKDVYLPVLRKIRSLYRSIFSLNVLPLTPTEMSRNSLLEF